MSALSEAIAVEADAVAAFVGLLGEELSQLKAGNADALPAIVEQKTQLIAKLAPLSEQRNALLKQHGLPLDRAGLEQWIASHPEDTDTRTHWQRLLGLASEAQELNRLNGQLINLRMSHNAQMLGALRNLNHEDFYGADGQAGQSMPGALRRIIDSA